MPATMVCGERHADAGSAGMNPTPQHALGQSLALFVKEEHRLGRLLAQERQHAPDAILLQPNYLPSPGL